MYLDSVFAPWRLGWHFCPVRFLRGVMSKYDEGELIRESTGGGLFEGDKLMGLILLSRGILLQQLSAAI